MADALVLGASTYGVWVQVPSPAPWRVFLQHLKGCKNTRFLYSEFTGGVMKKFKEIVAAIPKKVREKKQERDL